MVNWHRLIAERNEWVAHNFGEPNLLHIVFGMIEEVGELAHAHLKEQQNIRGDSESLQAEAKDALADLIIYELGLMHHWNFVPTPMTAQGPAVPDKSLLIIANFTGIVAAAVQMGASNPRAAEIVVYAAGDYARARGWDLAELVTSTWEEVKQRDWVRFPHDGLTR